MKIGVISDVHGNLPALEECLDRLRSMRVDVHVCLGDVFGYFPDGRACLALLMESGVELLMGNHEAMMLGLLPLEADKDAIYGLGQALVGLSRHEMTLLASLKPYCEREVDGRRLLFVHGTPWDPLQGRLYPGQESPHLEPLGFDAIFMGHTHRQHVWGDGKTVGANVGSCGLPRDIGALGSFGVYDTRKGVCAMFRFELAEQTMLETYPGIHETVRRVFTRNETVAAQWSKV